MHNDIFLLNKQLIRCAPDLDSAVIVLLKRALQFKQNNWYISFSSLHDIRLNGISLQKQQEETLHEGEIIRIYDHSFFVGFKSHFQQEALSTEEIPPPILDIQQNRDIDSTFTESLNNEITDSTLEMPALTETGHKTLSFRSEQTDILKDLEQEYNKVIIDPNYLIEKTMNQALNNEHIFEDMNYFEKGQLLIDESTEDIIDGKLGIDEIEALLGSDFNDDLFKTIKNDDVLMLFTKNKQLNKTSTVPSLTKKDFYTLTLNSPLHEIHFQTERAPDNNGETK